jgi:hypothetical protein
MPLHLTVQVTLLLFLLLLLLPRLLLFILALCRPFMQQLLHAALEHLGSALSTAFASLPNAATGAAGGSAAAAAAAGCPVEALGQYFMDLVYLDAVLSKAGKLCSVIEGGTSSAHCKVAAAIGHLIYPGWTLAAAADAHRLQCRPANDPFDMQSGAHDGKGYTAKASDDVATLRCLAPWLLFDVLLKTQHSLLHPAAGASTLLHASMLPCRPTVAVSRPGCCISAAGRTHVRCCCCWGRARRCSCC